MCESKEGLGLEMMKPRMMVEIKTLKMYLDNKRYRSKVSKIIVEIKEQSQVEYGVIRESYYNEMDQYQMKLWIDNVIRIHKQVNLIIY